MNEEKVPDWATHVATSTTNGRKEYCAWLEAANDYVDEDPSKLKDGNWAGSYKQCYWKFELIG